MSYTTPQRVRSTMFSRSYVSLRISFTQIRRIALSNTFAVLAVCYTRQRIDQKDSDTLQYNSIQTTEQARGTFLPPSTLQLIYLLYKLPNQPDGLLPSSTFMVCSIAKHQINQTDFYYLTLDGSTICNQLGLGGDQGFGWRLIYTSRWFNLQIL